MASVGIELVAGLLFIIALLLARQYCIRRAFTPPPIRLQLLAAFLTPIFNLLQAVLPRFIPSPYLLKSLQAVDELIIFLALTQLINWGIFQFPVDLKILKPVAKIIRDLIFFTASIIVSIIVIQNHFSINVISLAATSAVLTAVIGLAAQETLKNLFAGISLELDSPFEEGDWVCIGDVYGVIKSLRLMTTRIRTITGEIVVIPNSKLCNEGMLRVRRGAPVAQVIEIGLDYSLPPHRAIQLMTSVLRKHTMILMDPSPFVKIDHFDDSAIIYKIYLWHNEPLDQIQLRGEVLEHLWYATQREGQSFPFPVTEVILKDKANELPVSEDSIEDDIASITQLDYFEHFSHDMMQQLMIESTFHEYGAGETVIEEGAEGDSLYILINGCLQTYKAFDHGERERLIGTLNPVSIVGEMSFYTGKPRAATVRCVNVSKLLEIKRSTMTHLIRSDPSLLEKIGELIEKREQTLNIDIPKIEKDHRPNLLILMKQMFLHQEED